ncbi:hypothetical protein [uncultured Zobellia sp.]|uniref:hypothetical protein n=1 Tax=uncultured Zobellia sp. TaxID=255433 RepID=UPI00259434A5|nr:hypothetical protein [uncultured Zobellia sp.]
MHQLEQYYKGEENWLNFVDLYNEFWNENNNQIELLKALNNNLTIAKVIYGKMGNSSLKWINEKIPALDNLSPIECTKNPELIKRLKVCLKRMP